MDVDDLIVGIVMIHIPGKGPLGNKFLEFFFRGRAICADELYHKDPLPWFFNFYVFHDEKMLRVTGVDKKQGRMLCVPVFRNMPACFNERV